jgi:hypothetical protein
LQFWKSEIFFILGLDNEFRKSEVICPSGQFVAPAFLCADVTFGTVGQREATQGSL